MTEKGYMIVADISGYTAFLSDSELDHAGEILTSLLNAMLDNVNVPLILARVEGDAIFAYTLSNAILQGQTLLESLEQIYFCFVQSLESNVRNTTCTCKACANMSSLNLKIVVHYGEFALQELGKQTELVGSEVNLTHRLLKNNITKETGIQAYLFLSNAAIEAMRLENLTSQMIKHQENYDHLGKVDGWVHNLAPIWQREREKRRIYISPQEAEVFVEFDLPIPKMVAWDYINEPESRARYRKSDTSQVDTNDGRIEIGATYHCSHGGVTSYESVVDWKPFDYVTIKSKNKVGGVKFFNEFTTYLDSIDKNSTKISFAYTKPSGYNKVTQFVIDKVFNEKTKNAFIEEVSQRQSYLTDLIDKDKESGRLSMRLIAAGVEV